MTNSLYFTKKANICFKKKQEKEGYGEKGEKHNKGHTWQPKEHTHKGEHTNDQLSLSFAFFVSLQITWKYKIITFL